MSISKAKRVLRGDVNVGTAALEAMRRARVRLGRRNERALLSKLNRQHAQLSKEFANFAETDLLAHFRARTSPRFFGGFASFENTVELQRELLPEETALLIRDASAIVEKHCWPLLGFGDKCFGVPEIEWNLDPLSGVKWPLDYHAEVNLMRRDGSDARVVWEFNRLSHLLALGRAYALTKDEKISADFFRQVASWRSQNPIGRGVNWNCAMEVALRAMNLVGAFMLFLDSPQMTAEALIQLLTMFDQHGAHIRRNLEFSHIATSNHYLCDVTGLLWLGIMLPELDAAGDWREFGLHELLSEMDKQVLSDGADYEASSGYHRLKVELFLYSFILCQANEIEIDQKYWSKLSTMIDYVRAYLRPDGHAPLIGDSDSGQIFPIVKRAADDHAYLLSLAATVFQEPRFKAPNIKVNEEILWILGSEGGRDFQRVNESPPPTSTAFADAGIYIQREDDLYLLFNAGGIGVNGRGSHGHNDKLSVEVSACGTSFIADPGTYVYTADLNARNLFRSTAYHSTVQIDGVEQNSIDEQLPFVIGDEAHPLGLRCEPGPDLELVSAEHGGYRRLREPVTHRRTVTFHKRERLWIVNDEFPGSGQHEFVTRFHFNASLEVKKHNESGVSARDTATNARLFVLPRSAAPEVKLEDQFTSRDYGAKTPSVAACWSVATSAPCVMAWAILPVCANDDDEQRLKLLARFRTS